MTERELISALLYGLISMLVSYSFLFFYVSEIIKVKQGLTTGLEVVAKVFIVHVGIVFFFIIIFSTLDMFLPPDFKISSALDSFWQSAGIDNEAIWRSWLNELSVLKAEKEKFTIAWIIFYILLGKYLIDIITPFALTIMPIMSMMRSLNDGNDLSSPYVRVFKMIIMYVGGLMLLYTHLKIGSAAISPFVTMEDFDLYNDMQKNISIAMGF